MLRPLPPQPAPEPHFRDRTKAGARLAQLLVDRKVAADLVLGIPRGGLAVAQEVATRLRLPLDALVARKIGDPHQPELAIGAVTRFGVVWNQELLELLHLPAGTLQDVREGAMAELERREALFRRVRAPEPVAGRRVLVVDDGLATGATVAAAVQALHAAGAQAMIVAVPVASEEAARRVQDLGATVIAIATPRTFMAVGQFYDAFPAVPDEACLEILRRAAPTPPPADAPLSP